MLTFDWLETKDVLVRGDYDDEQIMNSIFENGSEVAVWCVQVAECHEDLKLELVKRGCDPDDFIYIHISH